MKDNILAQIMGFHEKQIPYLRVLYKEGLACDVNLLGERIDSIKPDHWKRAKRYGLFLNMIEIWAENIRIRIPKEKSKRLLLITLLTLIFALIIETSNAYLAKWWIYTNEWTFFIIILIWLLLGIILAFLNILNERKYTGPVFASYGIIVEIINLSFLNLWTFNSDIGLIGTFIVWILFGALFYCMYLMSSKFSKKVTS